MVAITNKQVLTHEREGTHRGAGTCLCVKKQLMAITNKQVLTREREETADEGNHRGAGTGTTVHDFVDLHDVLPAIQVTTGEIAIN